MATMIAADIASAGVGQIGAVIATAVLAGAGSGANGILAAGLRYGVEAAAIGVDQRFEADGILIGLRLQDDLRFFWLGWLVQRAGRFWRATSDGRGQRAFYCRAPKRRRGPHAKETA